MARTRITIVIPAGRADAARTWVRNHAAEQVVAVDSAGLSPTGAPPATHYAASGMFTDAERAKLRDLLTRVSWASEVKWQQEGDPHALLASLGLRPVMDRPDGV